MVSASGVLQMHIEYICNRSKTLPSKSKKMGRAGKRRPSRPRSSRTFSVNPSSTAPLVRGHISSLLASSLCQKGSAVLKGSSCCVCFPAFTRISVTEVFVVVTRFFVKTRVHLSSFGGDYFRVERNSQKNKGGGGTKGQWLKAGKRRSCRA